MSGTKGQFNVFGRMILVIPPSTTSWTLSSCPTHLIAFYHPSTGRKSRHLVTKMTHPTASPIRTRSALCGIMGSTLKLLLWIPIQTSQSCVPHLRSRLMLFQTLSLTTRLTLGILPTAIQWEKSTSPTPQSESLHLMTMRYPPKQPQFPSLPERSLLTLGMTHNH